MNSNKPKNVNLAPTGIQNVVRRKIAGKPKVVKSKRRHPPMDEMVLITVSTLEKRKGCSVQAIKKHILENYNILGDNNNLEFKRFKSQLKRCLKKAVATDVLIQTKGKGAVGSFKINKTFGRKLKKAKKNDVVRPKTSGELKKGATSSREFVKKLISTARKLASPDATTAESSQDEERPGITFDEYIKNKRKIASKTKINKLAKKASDTSSFQSANTENSIIGLP